MGNAVPDMCLSCFSRPNRPVGTMKPAEREYSPPTFDSVAATNAHFFPLQQEDSKCADAVTDGPPSAWFNLGDVSHALEIALGEFLKELEVAPAKDPLLELLINTEEFKVYGRETARGLLLKTEWRVPYTPQVYVDFIKNFEKRKEWDKNVDEYRKVCYLSEDVSVNYQRYKKVMVVSARELLVACKSMRKEGGWIDVSCSVTSPAFPIKDSIVRAHLHLGGYHVAPTPAGSSIVAVSEMDFGGSLPRSAMKKITAVGLLMFTKSLSAALAQAHSPR